MFLGACAGYAFSRFRFRGRRLRAGPPPGAQVPGGVDVLRCGVRTRPRRARTVVVGRASGYTVPDHPPGSTEYVFAKRLARWPAGSRAAGSSAGPSAAFPEVGFGYDAQGASLRR